MYRLGIKAHYTHPDSAIFYYRAIFEGLAPEQGELSADHSELEKAYIETVIRALNNTGNIYYYNDEFNRAEIYYQRSLELARAAGIDKLMAQAHYDIGYIRYMNNHFPAAISHFEQADRIYTVTNNPEGMYKVRQASGLAYRKLGNFTIADSIYRECMEIATELNDSMMIADVELHSGILLCEQGNMEEGIRLFEEALKYYENAGDENAVSIALLNIGVVLKMVNEYDKALSYIQRSTAIEETLQQKSQMVIRYYNMADLYLDMGVYDKALEYCQKIESVASEIGSRPFEAECNFIFGKYHYLTGDLENAGRYFGNALEGASRTNHMTLKANTFLWQARTFMNENDFQKAIASARESFDISTQLKLLLTSKEAALIISRAHEKSGNTVAALSWYKTYLEHSDSLSYFNQRQEISRIEARYNFEKKEKENELLRNRASLQEQKLRNRNIATIALVTVVGLSLVIILLLFRRNRDARLLFEQQEMINLRHLEEIEGELDGKKRELASKMLFLNQKNELISRLIKRLQEMQQSPEKNSDELVSIVNELRVDAPQSNWREFETQFTQVHPGFYQRLYEKHPDLTSYEQRICAFLRMNLNTKEISAITGRSPKSIEVTRSRIRQKLNLKRDDNLSSFLAAV